MTRRIIQFGTSRFLQAHVDLFVQEARSTGQAIGPITVVKTTPGRDRVGRVAAFKRGTPFPVRLRGVANGRVIDDTIDVASVDQAFDANQEWPAVVECFAGDADIAVSNVGDTGYQTLPEDGAYDLRSRAAPPSFPLKLLALLLARFRAGGRPLLVLPTELVSQNGSRLREAISRLASEHRLPANFRDWLTGAVTFADTLVDRIVSEAIEPVGAVAEPYALWAIRSNGFQLPLRHPAVQLVDDLEPFERLKLHILNLGHTVLAATWIGERRSEHETVRAILADHVVAAALEAIYAQEVLPGFAGYGMDCAAEAYVRTTFDRLHNPFLDHKLADIAQNHGVKTRRRVAGFIDWVRRRDPDFMAPRLDAIVRAR